MTTFHKRALLVLTALFLVLLLVLLFGWQIALVLSIVLSIGLSIPFSTLWQGFGKPAQPEMEQQEEYSSYQEGYQPPVVYHEVSSTPPYPHLKEEPVSEERPIVQYPQMLQ